MAVKNEQLLSSIQQRQHKQTEFGYGILTADRHVRNLENVIGLDSCYQYASTRSSSYNDIVQKASQTLVYSNPDMEVKETGLDDLRARVGEDVVLPKNMLMAFAHTLTSTRKDRDNDVLEAAGAVIDPRMLLLWQHVPTLPIGKMLAVTGRDDQTIQLISAIVDMNDLSHDAAVMVDNGMGRFSHGFRALEFEELNDEEFPGFHVLKYEVMEESLVSVPSNVDATTQEILVSLVEGDKLTSPLMKEMGRSIRRGMPSIVSGGIHYRTNGNESEITCGSVADLKAVAEAGLLAQSSTEDIDVAAKSKKGKRSAGKSARTSKEAQPNPEQGEQQGQEEEAAEYEEMPNDGAMKLKEAAEDLKEAIVTEELSRGTRSLLTNAMENLQEIVEALPAPAEGEEVPEEGKQEEAEPTTDRPVTLLPKGTKSKLEEVVEDLELATETEEMPRAIHSLVKSAIRALKEVAEQIEEAEKQEEEETEDPTPPAPTPETPTPEEPKSAKAGRALSKSSEGKIKEAIEDLQEAAEMEEVSRGARSLIKSAIRQLTEVMESTTPPAPAEGGEEEGKAVELTADKCLEFFLANADKNQQQKASSILLALLKIDDTSKAADAVRRLVGILE